MITDFELRVLSELAYIDNLGKEYYILKNQTLSNFPKTNKIIYKKTSYNTHSHLKNILDNWHIIEYFRDVNNTGIEAHLDAYLFRRIDGFYVIAFRGTNSKSRQFIYDMKENLNMFFTSQVTDVTVK